MNIVNKKLTLEKFKEYIRGKEFYPNMPYRLVIHHTWKPTEKDWRGQPTIDGLKKYYEGKGWITGPHIFIAPDGIWLFTDMKTQGTHAGVGNYRSIGIEVVGDYDGAKWTGKIKEQAVGVIKALMEELNITEENICRHNDFNKAKTCPGKMITKKWILEQLKKTEEKPQEEIKTVSIPIETTKEPIITEQKDIWQDAVQEIIILIKKFINIWKN